MKAKSTAQLRYEAYVERFPTYSDGIPRPDWKGFQKICKSIDSKATTRANAIGRARCKRLEREQQAYLAQHPHLRHGNYSPQIEVLSHIERNFIDEIADAIAA